VNATRRAKLPTIVLIGGQLTLSDGSEVNSRQDATDDLTAGALQDALIGCPEWWSAVSSIVVPTLADPEGGFAVIFSPRRSILHVTSDGEIHRRALRKFLPGTFGSVSVMRSSKAESLPADYRILARLRSPKGTDMGSVGVRFDNPIPRWSIVDVTDSSFGIVTNRMSRILVDATGTVLNSTNDWYSTLPTEYSVASLLQIVVMPDTVDVRNCIADHLAGKIPEPPELPEQPAPDVPPTAPRDPADFLRIPVLRAACSVTGLLRAGQWEDAAGLEAARMLLLQRYDLKLGLWDLALNPVLRSTVLETLPVQPAPDEPVQAPASAWKRAERKAEDATARGEAKRLKIRQANAALKQELERDGWRLDHALLPRANVEKYGPWLYLPLTEPIPVWKGEAQPLVALRIDVRASSIRVVVWNALEYELDVRAFIERKREDFESVAPLPPFPKGRNEMPLWTASIGWNDTEAEWSSIAKEIAEHTKRWVEVLADFVASAREVRDKLYREWTAPKKQSPVHTIVVKLPDLTETIKSLLSRHGDKQSND
jgi:hypothetical protein